MKEKISRFSTLLVIAGSIAGCSSLKQPSGGLRLAMQAPYAHSRIIVDGWLDETVWKNAPSHPLFLIQAPNESDPPAPPATPKEMGKVQLAWDDEYFYVAVEFEDLDIIAEGRTDQIDHRRLGDLVEVFLKPDNETGYWELCATPRGKKTSLWLPGRGRFGLKSSFQYHCGLRVGAKVDGSINDWRDKDRRWTAELAMPIKDLIAHGQTFGPNSSWRILIARRNYSRYRPQREPEQTTSPMLTTTDLYQLEAYAPLCLTK